MNLSFDWLTRDESMAIAAAEVPKLLAAPLGLLAFYIGLRLVAPAEAPIGRRVP